VVEVVLTFREVERVLKVGRGSSAELVLMETARNHQVESLIVLKLVGEVRIPSECVLKLAEVKGVLNVVLKWEAGRNL
jgi:hypothetical protein